MLAACSGKPLDVGTGTEPIAACSDGMRDYGESDVDCGGTVCGGCDAHQHCTVAADCKSGVCVGGSCCGAGTADCDGNAANGCESTLASDDANCGTCHAACAVGEHCVAGVCTTPTCMGPPHLLLGQPCNCAPECQSGFCVDGVCCNAACSGTCTACNQPGTVGTCSPVTGAPTAGHGSCSTGETCVAGTCMSGSCSCTPAHAVGTCASGTCAIVSCDAGFADCDQLAANGCERDVTSDDSNCGACANQCPMGQHCVASVCTTPTCVGQPHLLLGQPCTCAADCQSGFCVDGVCCNAACSGTCTACDQPGTAGTCSQVTGAPVAGHGSCPAGQTCSSGACH
jgi:hypothetical protein